MFGADNRLDVVKRFQMLLADGRENADVRGDQFAKLADVAGLPRSHFHDEHFMHRRQRGTNHFRHAHRRVVAFRRHDDMEMFG